MPGGPPKGLPAGREAGLLVVLSGPSGVGKGAVVAGAIAARAEGAALRLRSGQARSAGSGQARLQRSVSATTRPPRADEIEGRDYFFRSREEFQGMVQQGELLEWATYLDHSYGTPQGWVDQQLGAGYDVVLEIEVQGAMQVRERRPEAVLIYMLPPSWAALRSRLKKRRSETEELQQRRLEVAQREMAHIRDYDYVIVNDRVASAARTLLAILAAEHARVSRGAWEGKLRDMNG